MSFGRVCAKYQSDSELKPDCWTHKTKFHILWVYIVALCEHSEHKLTRFNFVKHNGCIDNARGTIRGFGHIEDYWELGCGAFVADFCWNLFKESGIGILCHNLPQWFLSRNLPKIDNSQSFKGFHRCYFLCPWCSEILIRSRATRTLFHPRIFYWLLTAIKDKRYWDFLLSS